MGKRMNKSTYEAAKKAREGSKPRVDTSQVIGTMAIDREIKRIDPLTVCFAPINLAYHHSSTVRMKRCRAQKVWKMVLWGLGNWHIEQRICKYQQTRERILIVVKGWKHTSYVDVDGSRPSVRDIDDTASKGPLVSVLIRLNRTRCLLDAVGTGLHLWQCKRQTQKKKSCVLKMKELRRSYFFYACTCVSKKIITSWWDSRDWFIVR